MDNPAADQLAGFLKVIKERHSVRAFRPDPVPKEALRQVLEAAIRAPSWSDTQPWEFTVVSGQRMERLKEAIMAKFVARALPKPDVTFPVFDGVYLERSRDNGRRLFAELGIGREDQAKRAAYRQGMSRFFDAPAGIIIHMDKKLSVYSFLDIGLALENLLLAAHCLGLGTCPEIMVVTYPEVLRELLGIPEAQNIVCGVAIGYPIEDSPATRFRSVRDPLESFVTWRDDD